MLLVHGDQDPLIPVEAMFMAMDDLAKAEIPASGICRSASATASTPAVSATVDCSWPRRSGSGRAEPTDTGADQIFPSLSKDFQTFP